jgi:alpha-1,2-mannosyltransferase
VKKRAQICIAVALAVAALVFDAIFAVRHGFFDLNVYYGAIHYWADGGSLYDFVRKGSTYGFTYPPFAALTMLPMALLSWPVAVVIGSIATIGVTVWLMRELLAPVIAARGWTPWFVLAISLCLLAVYEPFRETFLFGQVNMLLVGLVAADLLLLVTRRSRWAGVGIGLATAIKLTPGIFIVYLLITKRWRAALVASGAAAGATLLAAAIAPDASREFWTSALWDTDRVGALAFISNQSVQGVLARLDPAHPSKLLWALGVLAVLAVWFVRARRAAASGDEMLGLALTGIVGVLISPVTWVHHLVWAIPAFVLILQRGSRWLQILAALAFAVLSSRLVWLYQYDFSGVDGFVFSNAYVWIMLALLALTPGLVAAKGDLQLGGVEVAAGVPVKVPRSVRV